MNFLFHVMDGEWKFLEGFKSSNGFISLSISTHTIAKSWKFSSSKYAKNKLVLFQKKCFYFGFISQYKLCINYKTFEFIFWIIDHQLFRTFTFIIQKSIRVFFEILRNKSLSILKEINCHSETFKKFSNSLSWTGCSPRVNITSLSSSKEIKINKMHKTCILPHKSL